MDKQMQLFEEGGLNQEGGMIDEVSGNDVPVGSTREEVRDDIPAQLSEGEFVFPADVTRYIGLDKLMQLRQQAKMGLKKMEAMGQMGNSDEATLPDDLPFGMEDLIIIQAEGGDEPQEFNQGGMPVNPNTGVYYTGNTGVTMQPPTQQPPTGGVQPSPQPTMPPPPTQPTGGATGGYQPLFMQGQQTTTAPTFSTLMEGAELSYKTYINADGETILVPFIGDNALYPIPEGYFEKGSADDPTLETGEEEDTGEAVEAVAQAASDDDDRGPAIVEPSAFQKAGGWGMDTSGKDGAALDMWIKEAQKVTGHGNVVTGLLGLINPLMGAAAWAANKHQKQQIMSMLDEKIAQAKLTPIAGQVAALEKIKDELENGSNAGLLGTVIEKIGEVIGLKPEETEVAKNNTTAVVTETVDKPTDDIEATEDKTTDKITTIDGTTAESVITGAGYSSVEDYAAEIQRRMLEGNETQQDVIKQSYVGSSDMPPELRPMYTIKNAYDDLYDSAMSRQKDGMTIDEVSEDFKDYVAQKRLIEMGNKELIAAAKSGKILPLKAPDYNRLMAPVLSKPLLDQAPVVSADETARANLAATALKDRGVTAQNITAAEFDLIKNSAEAKRALGIAPTIMTYADVKTNGTDIPSVVTTTPETTAD